MIEKRLIEEIERYNQINRYIIEQEETEPAAADDAAPEGEDTTEPADDLGGDLGGEEDTTPIDVETDPDVEKVDDSGETESPAEPSDMNDEGVEELEITDLVNKQDDILAKQDEFMNSMFSKLEDLNSRISAMDSIIQKIDTIDQKIEKYREKSPVEKLELRSLDSYPYNQKLTDFFDIKKGEMEVSGKNEYVLTSDDVEDYDEREIRNSFNPNDEDFPI